MAFYCAFIRRMVLSFIFAMFMHLLLHPPRLPLAITTLMLNCAAFPAIVIRRSYFLLSHCTLCKHSNPFDSSPIVLPLTTSRGSSRPFMRPHQGVALGRHFSVYDAYEQHNQHGETFT